MTEAVLSAGRPARPARLLAFFGTQEGLLLLAILAVLVIVGIMNPRFLAERNLWSIAQTSGFIAVAAIGMSMVIISGNIDISVGALIGVLATISGTLAVSGMPLVVAWTAPVVVGIAATSVMGFFVAYLKIPSIIVTLGMLSILKGGLIVVTNGKWISDLPPGYQFAQIMIGDVVPMSVLLMVVLTVGAALWMRRSAGGRAIYAVGGNVEAARLCGISPERTILKVFAIHGFFVGVSAVLFATQLNVIQSTVPPNLELTIITASVVGGVSILGGAGTVVGSTLAAVLLGMIGSALIFVGVSPYWLRAVQGILILVTVLADVMRRRARRM